VLIWAPRRNASVGRPKEVVGEAPTTAREARALPGKDVSPYSVTELQPIRRSSSRWLADLRLRFAATLLRSTPMRKVNTNNMEELVWSSPKGKFGGAGKQVSEALGRKPFSTDLMERHPFDIEILRIPPGKAAYPYHTHSAQWEFYHIISGRGVARHQDGKTSIEPGDAFIFAPNEPHQLINNGDEDLVMYVVADNPIGESGFYPDSNKWIVRCPERAILRSNPLDYFDGEE